MDWLSKSRGLWPRRVWWFEWKCAHRLRYLTTWALVGGTVWGGYGIFRRQSLSGECPSLGMAFGSLRPFSLFHLTPSASCLWKNRCSLIFLLLPCLPCHYSSASVSLFLPLSVSLELQAKINSLFPRLLWSWYFITVTESN